MKKVRCISPHGGCRYGMLHNGHPVLALPDGSVPGADPGRLRLPPNPGGYVQDGRVRGGYAAVGAEYDVPDGFYADGFHWEEAGGGATKLPEPESPPAPLSLTIAASTAPPPPASDEETGE